MAGEIRDTFFFDLDGTLLPLDMDAFLKAYYNGITKCGVCDSIHPTDGMQMFEKAVYAMMGNDGSMTNQQAFFETLNKLSGTTEAQLMPLMDEFYVGEYATIKNCTYVEEDAVQIVKLLKEKGYRLVLATNPLFPQTATNQRIAWGGLSIDDFEYISYYSNSRYCKPSHGYFTEILDKLGLSAEQCYMVGNDARDDMSAMALGFEGYLLTNHLIGEIGKVTGCKKGDYSELLKLVKNLPRI
jgi:HAD superfamily hydrolase (TIGR01549 family)